MLNGQKKKNLPDAAAGTSHNRRGLMRRLLRNESGTSSIEFALLALPFMIVIFASMETFVAFTAEQLLANATETMSRKIRTGAITLGADQKASQEAFRTEFCKEISIIIPCSATEVKQPDRLFIDVRSFPDFSKMPIAIPRTGTGANADIDVSGFKFAPGGPTTINMVRVYYRWEVITDLIRPYVTNLRSAGSSMPNDYLMVATSTFRNENY